LRLAYLAPEVLKRLTCGREASAVNLYDLSFWRGKLWENKLGASSENEWPIAVISQQPACRSTRHFKVP
jgi:hypothetical protein